MSNPLQNKDKVTTSAPASQRPIALEKMLNISVTKTDSDASVRKVDSKQIIDFIVTEMLAHSNPENADFIRVKGLFEEFKKSDVAPALRVTALIRALYEFLMIVNYGAKWDQKTLIKNTWGKTSFFLGVELEFDIWSNIHYGFVGRQIGFNPEVLLTGAGYAQAAFSQIPRGWFERWVSGQAPYLGQAFDDPVDQASIQLGMQLSNAKGRSLGESDLTSLLKKNLSQVSRK